MEHAEQLMFLKDLKQYVISAPQIIRHSRKFVAGIQVFQDLDARAACRTDR